MTPLLLTLATFTLIGCHGPAPRQPSASDTLVHSLSSKTVDSTKIRAPNATIGVDVQRLERGDTLSKPAKPLPAEPSGVRVPRGIKPPERRFDVPLKIRRQRADSIGKV